MKMKELSWKPVRKGKIYCSPGCGRGCTYAEYLSARDSASELCKILGKGFKPRVWENGSWYFSVQKGAINLYESSGKYYSLLSETVGGTAGSCNWSSSYSDKDPKKVIAKQLKAAREHVLKCLKAIESVEK